MGYREVVLADRPTHYFPLGDRASGQCLDLIPGGASGTYPSAPTFGDRWLVDGRVPKFASPSYAAVGSWGFPAAPWTFEYWAIVNSFNNGWVIARDDLANRGWGFRFNSVGSLASSERNGITFFEPTFVFSLNTRHHIVWDWDGATYRFWVNGRMTQSASNATNLGDLGTAATNIGRRAHPGAETPFDGWIGHIAQYPRLLGGGRLLEHYLAGIGGRPARRIGR